MTEDMNSFSQLLGGEGTERFIGGKKLKFITTYITQQFQWKLGKYLSYIVQQWLMFSIKF